MICVAIAASVLVVLHLFPDVALVFQIFVVNLIPVTFFVGLIVCATGSLLVHPAGKAITASYGAAMLAIVVVPSVVPLARVLFLTKAMVVVPLLAGILLLLTAPFHKRWWS